MKKIIVLGGGTSGLCSALMINAQYPETEVVVIASKNIGIIGVGEGGTEHWYQFCDRIGVDVEDTIEACGGTLKGGIKFMNWGVPDYIHNTSDVVGQVGNDYYFVYSKIIAEQRPVVDMSLMHVLNSTVRKRWVENPGGISMPVSQIHFNTFKTNEWMRNLCSERGVEIIDDTINDIVLDDHGNISSLVGNLSTYSADFFVDASGMSRVLINKLGAQWISYKDNLFVNSAIAFPTEDTEEYPMYTGATAMDYGWMWNTPVQGRWGNGYVFCDRYIDFDQAQAEVEKKLGKKVEIAKRIKFEAGRIDRPWIKNCLAVGLSTGFIEPLESTAISQGILQTFLFMNLLPSWINGQEEIAKLYNDKNDYLSENLRDFIAIHYIVPREDTEFWKDLKTTRDTWIPESLKEKLKKWQHRLPNKIEFMDKFGLFTADNWIHTIYALGLFDVDSIKKEYDSLPSYMKAEADRIFQYRYTELEEEYIPHKQALEQYLPNWKQFKKTRDAARKGVI
jgi:Tryptophan halogenase